MRERDLQEHLYNHPEVLFPGRRVEERHREYQIAGRRVDLLFKVEGCGYIVELKVVPITREHVGQLVEYYGLMRQRDRGARLKMMLAAPEIPQ